MTPAHGDEREARSIFAWLFFDLLELGYATQPASAHGCSRRANVNTKIAPT